MDQWVTVLAPSPAHLSSTQQVDRTNAKVALDHPHVHFDMCVYSCAHTHNFAQSTLYICMKTDLG